VVGVPAVVCTPAGAGVAGGGRRPGEDTDTTISETATSVPNESILHARYGLARMEIAPSCPGSS